MKLKTELFPYQQAAVDKLMPLKVGALYMEMGTGKTRTTLELIQRRIELGRVDHVLWLCPCSVRENLKTDIQYHAEEAFVKIAVYGIESLSSSIRLYEQLLKYVKAKTTMIVVDESNLVKNSKAIRTQRITDLASLCKYRIILNGTPISRNEVDFFAQWYILDWRILGYRSFWSFAKNHIEYDPDIRGKIRRTLNVDYLVEKMAPYSYLISKDECFKLPCKSYDDYSYDMTYEQERHYDNIMDYMLSLLNEQKPATVYRMFSAAQAVISGLWVRDKDEHLIHRPMFLNPKDNPRIKTLLNIISDVDSQAIIFSKYTHEIQAILSTLPDAIGFYGGITPAKRQENLEKFRNKKVRFLVANKVCAGYGLNLQFCNTIIFYSNDWDWATRIQAEDRVHRLGQKNDVKIYDIIANRSLDKRIIRCLRRKENLVNDIKRELKNSNDIFEASGTFRKWLKGEMDDGKTISK